MSNKQKNMVVVMIISVIAIVALSVSLFNGIKAEPPIKYSKIVQYFEEEQVASFDLDFNKSMLSMKLKDGKEITNYKVPALGLFIEKIDPYIDSYNSNNPENQMEYDYTPATESSWLVSLIPNIFMIIIILFFYMYIAKSAMGGAGKVGGFNKAKIRYQASDGKKTFKDVAGADEEKKELEEVVEFLKNPKKFSDLGARIPKGVLMVGPPGTGKTLLAKAVAGEAGVPFFSIAGSDFLELYVGVGASRVRDLFETAKKESPSIIFIDEIDAVGRKRGAGLGGGHDEREQTLNQLLVEMDGFGPNSGVIVIAATNRNDVLDPALLRSGRFDRQVVVNYPDAKGREEILKIHMQNKPLAPDVDLKTVAHGTPGFVGADIENLCNEAALLAARHGQKAITAANIEDAIMKVLLGPEKKSKIITEKDKKITAYHEAGHAVASYFCPNIDPVHEISIIPRGMAGGYTLNIPINDKLHVMKKQLEENIVMTLGGRVAEKLIFDDISTGASGDIAQATKTAKSMVTKYGFSEKLGNVLYGTDQGEVFLGRDIGHGKDYSEKIASQIDEEVISIIRNAEQQCTYILSNNINKLHEVAQYLFENEKMTGEQFRQVMSASPIIDSENSSLD